VLRGGSEGFLDDGSSFLDDDDGSSFLDDDEEELELFAEFVSAFL